jgi:hypothetical protein
VTSGDGVVHLQHSAGHLQLREVARDPLPACCAEPPPELRVRTERTDRLGQPLGVARRHEQARLSIGDELRGTADRRRNHRLGVGHRLEHDHRQALDPRRQDEDIELVQHRSRVVAEAQEVHAIGGVALPSEPLEHRPVGPALLEVGTRQGGMDARDERDRLDQLALPLHVAEPRDLAEEDGVLGHPELRAQPGPVSRGLCLDIDSVVDDLDEPRRIALRDERSACVVRDRDHAGGEARAAVVERRVDGASQPIRAEVVFDVDVRHHRGAAESPGCAGEDVGRERGVRVEHVGVKPTELACEPERAAELVRPRHVHVPHVESLAVEEVGERPAGRREEDDAVAAGPRGARELQRNDLAACDLAADHEVGDGHGRCSMRVSILAAAVGPIRRLSFEAAVEVALAATVFLFACGSSSSHALAAFGGPGRWAALLLLCALSLAYAGANPRLPSPVPLGWILAAAIVAVGTVSAAWSVDPRLTIGRVFTLGILFVTAVALSLAPPDPKVAAVRVLRGVVGGIAAVAIGSLVMLAVSHRDAVLSATVGAGWRFRGLGENPNTVAMLLSVGLPLAAWLALDGKGWERPAGVALVLLFAGEIAVSGSRGAVLAGFGGAILTVLVLGPSLVVKLGAACALVVLALISAETSRLQPSAKLGVAAAVAAPAGKVVRTVGIDAEQAFRLEDELGHPPVGAYSPPVPRTLFGSSGRSQAWVGAIDQAVKRPVLGYGFGTENKVFVDRFFAFEGGFPENSYIGTFLQLGAAGIALLVGLLLTLARNAYRVLRRGDGGPAAAAAGVLAVAILIGVSQSGLTSVGNIAAASIWVCVLTLPALALGAGRS